MPTKVKRPAAKGAGTKTTTTKKTPAKVATTKTKTATTKTKAVSAEPKAPRQVPARDFDVFGFVVGGDSSIIAHCLAEGVSGGRDAMNELCKERIAATNGLQTRNGSEKYVPSLVSGVALKMRDMGFTAEMTYKMVPPPDMAKAVAAAKRKSAAANKNVAKPTTKKAPAKKKASVRAPK